ncbi:MAG: PA2169 family four-helix-bundle protein [Sphingobacteriales bacterium]|nr:MAG: PA2169 family four-helix-bundle protein [Sphingobacteriales bacterium]
MSRNEQSVEILNDLVKINNDRIEGYERASKEARDEDADLKSTFSQMAAESRQYKQELSEKVSQMGAEPETGTRTDGKIYRMWMDVKAMFTGSSRKAVLENCEFGEDAAQRAYEEALNDSELSPELRQIVSRQQQSLRQSHDTIKRMRDSE